MCKQKILRDKIICNLKISEISLLRYLYLYYAINRSIPIGPIVTLIVRYKIDIIDLPLNSLVREKTIHI